MSDLREQLDEALARDGDGRAELHGPGWTAQLDHGEAGPVGVVVERLRVEGRVGDLVDRAQVLADTLRPAGERLQPVEVDPALGGAVLRTRPDDMRGGRFFQLEVDRGGAELTRQRRRAEGGRVEEPFPMTREELSRVLEALGEVLGAPEDEVDGG